jgi:nucleotide-sensitive chloride channel 1A
MVVLTSFPPPTEGIRNIQPNTHAHVGRRNLGKGTIYIAESRLSWVSDGGDGFSLEYPSISIHAVSRDLSAYPQECVYLMLDTKLEESDDGQRDGNSDEDSDDEEKNFTEVRFIPEDKSVLDALFHSMSDCQALHPDPNDSDSGDDFIGAEDHGDGDDEENAYDEDEENEDVTGMGDGNPVIFSRQNQDTGGDSENMDTSQFEDAEPEH